ncbi:MAG: hypothetical protein PW788_10730 [Micavibrio sp.]|nr:hypothetical protein [Micavibrio sp.]
MSHDPDSRTDSFKTYEVTYKLPDNLVEEEGLAKSLNFHRFMRHARDCHKNLLEFLAFRNLTPETGISTMVANERKTIIECSPRVIEQICALPFVEKAEETVSAMHNGAQLRRPPAANG